MHEAQEDRKAQEEHASKAVARAAPPLPSALEPAVLVAAAGDGGGAWRTHVWWEAALEVIHDRLGQIPAVPKTLRDVRNNLSVAALRGDGGELLGAASIQGTGEESSVGPAGRNNLSRSATISLAGRPEEGPGNLSARR